MKSVVIAVVLGLILRSNGLTPEPLPFMSPEPLMMMMSPEPTYTAMESPEPMMQGPISGCGPTALFCEDFESMPTKPWRLEGSAQVVSTVPTRDAQRGKRVLRLNPVGGKFGRLMLDNFRPPRNSFFGRLYVRVDKFPTAPNYAHWVISEVVPMGEQGERIRPLNGQLINEVGGINMWGVGSDGGPTGDWTAWKESVVAAEKKWTCMEWQMEASDSSVRVWIDNIPKPELQVSMNNHGGKNTTQLMFPQFDKIWFGFWNFQPDTTPSRFNVHIDSIVLDTKRVGC